MIRIGVIFVQRQPPAQILRTLASGQQRLSQIIGTGKHATTHPAQCDDASARQRGDINDGPGFEALCIGQGITQNRLSR